MSKSTLDLLVKIFGAGVKAIVASNVSIHTRKKTEYGKTPDLVDKMTNYIDEFLDVNDG